MPEGLSFNRMDNLFFNTRSGSNGAVWELPGGIGPRTQATAVYTGFGEGTAFKCNGNLLAVARAEGRAYEFAPPFSSSNTGTLFASGLVTPFGIAVNSFGEVFVADRGTASIQKFGPTGTPFGAFATGLSGPGFLEFDDADNLYVTTSGPLYKIAPDGTKTIIGNFPSGVGLAFCGVRKVDLDIKPQSCPNPVNVKSNGVLPVAILGTDLLDVNDIDLSTIRLEGVAPLRSSIEDVATPVYGDGDQCQCICTTAGPDGFEDLTLKFRKQSIVAALGEVNDGDVIRLTLTGEFSNLTGFEGHDCIIIRKKGKFSEIPSPVVNSSTSELFTLLQNQPNPFSTLTAISYELKAPSHTTLQIFDITGRLVRTLVDEEKEIGIYSVEWDGTGEKGEKVTPGIYFTRLATHDTILTKKTILLR
jgi:hypothetical protein